MQELEDCRNGEDEDDDHDEETTSGRMKTGRDFVSQYLMIDLGKCTKKAEKDLLKRHPLAAPRKSVRLNGRSRASRATEEDVGEDFLVRQQVLTNSEEAVESSNNPRHRDPRSEDGKRSSSSVSERFSLDSDLEDDIDDLDLMQLETVSITTPPTSVFATSPGKISAIGEGSPAEEQAKSASIDDDYTMYDDRDLTDMDVSVVDELCNLDPSAALLPRLHRSSQQSKKHHRPMSNYDPPLMTKVTTISYSKKSS